MHKSSLCKEFSSDSCVYVLILGFRFLEIPEVAVVFSIYDWESWDDEIFLLI